MGHEIFQQALPEYVMGRLAREEAERVEVHLGQCEECAEMRESLVLLATTFRREGESLVAPHPADDELRSLALGRLDTAAEERIARHLGSCAMCELTVAAWRRRQGRQEIPASGVSGTSAVLDWGEADRPRGLFRHARDGAAGLAAGALVGLALGLWLMWEPTSTPQRPGSRTAGAPSTIDHPASSGPLVILRSLRGSAPPQRVTLSLDEVHVHLATSLTLPPDAAPGDFIFFEILGPDGGAVWVSAEEPLAKIRRQIEGSGVVTHRIEAEKLLAGLHLLRVVKTHAGSEDLVQQVRFEVVRIVPNAPGSADL